MAPTAAFASVPLIRLLSFGLFYSLVFSLPFLFPQISHVSLPRLEDERRFAVILGAELGPVSGLLCNLVTRLVTRVDCWEVWRAKQTIECQWERQGLETSMASPLPF